MLQAAYATTSNKGKQLLLPVILLCETNKCTNIGQIIDNHEMLLHSGQTMELYDTACAMHDITQGVDDDGNLRT